MYFITSATEDYYTPIIGFETKEEAKEFEHQYLKGFNFIFGRADDLPKMRNSINYKEWIKENENRNN